MGSNGDGNEDAIGDGNQKGNGDRVQVGNDGNQNGNEDGNQEGTLNGMQKGPQTQWQARFWSDAPIGEPQNVFEEDEPVGVNEEHLYGVVDPRPQAINMEGVNEIADQDVTNEWDPQYVPMEQLPLDREGNPILLYVHNRKNPGFKKDTTFSNIKQFKLAIRQHAIKGEFEFDISHSNKERYIASCPSKGDCRWRIYAKKEKTCSTWTITKVSKKHTCYSTSKLSGRMASQGWIADRVKDILSTKPKIGAKKLQDRLEKKYNVTLRYGWVWKGLPKALDEMNGSWESSFHLLWVFKSEIERANHGSIVDIDVTVMGSKVFFNRLFVAFKPCIDGFLKGCRPYLGCDSSLLTGKYKGQIVSVVGVDRHNWLFPVAYGIFDKETASNWEWFIQRLWRAIGTPPGLVIHSNSYHQCLWSSC